MIETAASALGLEIARVVHATDPGLIVLGGGLGLNERYRGLVETAIVASIDPIYANAPRVVSAALGENVGIIGAALAAISVDYENNSRAIASQAAPTGSPEAAARISPERVTTRACTSALDSTPSAARIAPTSP